MYSLLDDSKCPFILKYSSRLDRKVSISAKEELHNDRNFTIKQISIKVIV